MIGGMIFVTGCLVLIVPGTGYLGLIVNGANSGIVILERL
jgi:hypothetical protein